MERNEVKVVNGSEIIFRTFHLSKKGKRRLLYSAQCQGREIYKKMASAMYDYYSRILQDETFFMEKVCRKNAVYPKHPQQIREAIACIPHAFFQGRSAVTNARQHIGFAITINLDIKDFFSNVRPDMHKKCLVSGRSGCLLY